MTTPIDRALKILDTLEAREGEVVGVKELKRLQFKARHSIFWMGIIMILMSFLAVLATAWLIRYPGACG
jgi:hypothetical protein